MSNPQDSLSEGMGSPTSSSSGRSSDATADVVKDDRRVGRLAAALAETLASSLPESKVSSISTPSPTCSDDVKSRSMRKGCRDAPCVEAVVEHQLSDLEVSTRHRGSLLSPSLDPKLSPVSTKVTSCGSCRHCGDTCGNLKCKSCNLKMKELLAKTSESASSSFSLFRRQQKPSFTLCQVKRHTTKDDCWLVAHGRVYDVTKFVPDHPAGASTILRHAGGDCTEDFEFHSKCAQKMWRKMEIGCLVPCPGCHGTKASSDCVIS